MQRVSYAEVQQDRYSIFEMKATNLDMLKVLISLHIL